MAKQNIGVLFLAIAVLFLRGTAYAGTYYTSPNGADSYTCMQAQSPSTPKATIQAAIGCLTAGDTLIVRDGTYSGSGASQCGGTPIFCVTTGGLPGAWITVRAEKPCSKLNSTVPVCSTKLDGIGLRSHGILLAGSVSFVRIEGFEITGTTMSAVLLNNTGSDFELSGNYIHAVGRVCDTVTGTTRSGIYNSRSRVLIDRNLITDVGRYANGENGCSGTVVNQDHGIYSSGSDVTIRNNVMYSLVRGYMITIYHHNSACAVTNLRILNNTFVFPHPNRDGHIQFACDISNSDIANNISYSPTKAFMNYFAGAYSGVTVRNNMVYNASLGTSAPGGITNSGNVSADPQFVDASARNFRLKSGSRAIDTGLILTDVDRDYDGISRSRHDIGAHEFGGGGAPAPPTGVRIVVN